MSGPSVDPRRARRILKALRGGRVPEPGDAYWASFTARLRRGLAEDGMARDSSWRPAATTSPRVRLALGLAATLVLAGVIWQAAGQRTRPAGVRDPLPPADARGEAVDTREQAAAERLEALPAELLERALDDVVGTGTDDLSGAAGLTGEDRRRLLEELRLEVAEGAPPRAADSPIPEARTT